MNTVLIFAGGTGQRMNSKTLPKQFLELRGKPIIIYTLDQFDTHPDIDGIIVVCVESWIPFLEKQLRKFEISKVVEIVPGGETGQDSIYKGLNCASRHFSLDSCVLIHDGVRPLITQQTITDNIVIPCHSVFIRCLVYKTIHQLVDVLRRILHTAAPIL